MSGTPITKSMKLRRAIKESYRYLLNITMNPNEFDSEGAYNLLVALYKKWYELDQIEKEDETQTFENQEIKQLYNNLKKAHNTLINLCDGEDQYPDAIIYAIDELKNALRAIELKECEIYRPPEALQAMQSLFNEEDILDNAMRTLNDEGMPGWKYLVKMLEEY